MSITITMIESSREYLSGIPEYIELSTDSPSTIFYTMDGTYPDTDSDIYIERLYLPTDGVSFVINAIAISGEEVSGLFSHEFSTDQSEIKSRRLTGDEGINVLKVGEDVVDNLSIDIDGYAAQETAIEFSDLDIKTSQYNSQGYENPGKTSVDFINFAEAEESEVEIFQGKSSSINNNAYFDPKAGVIYVDGSSQDALDRQEVRIINRPSGTISTFGDNYNDHILQSPPLTGNLVRSMYNPQTGVYVSYYYESKECRWIQSTQNVGNNIKLDISKRTYRKNNFVYKWITARHMSKIF